LKGDKPTAPEAIKTIASWTKFKKLMTTYLAQIQGMALCPLIYVIPTEAAVGDVQRNAVYNTNQAWLVRCTVHKGSWYQTENQCIYDKLKTLVFDGTLWPFVQCYDLVRDGRSAWMTLVIQSEGRANNQLR
jgi:hypothetical protein